MVPFVQSIPIFEVTLDSSLTMNKHFTNTAAICNTYIRSLRHVHSSLTTQAAVLIACILINTHLDYCNSLLYGTSAQNLAKLQRIQYNLTKTVLKLPQFTSIYI